MSNTGWQSLRVMRGRRGEHRSRRWSIFAAAGALVAATALSGGGVADASSGTAQGGWKGGGPLAAGLVLDASGKADRRAVVLAYAWPDESVLRGKPVGAKLPLVRLGKARVDAAGRYSLHVPPGQLMHGAGAHGYVNLELVAVSGGRQITYDYSVRPFAKGSPNATDSWAVMGASDQNPAPMVDFDFKAESVNRTPEAADDAGTSHLAPLTEKTPSGMARGTLAAAADPVASMSVSADASLTPDSVPYCYLVAGAYSYNNKEHFSTLYTESGIPATLTEGTSTTHTMGIATTLDHKSWSANGSSSITHTSTASATATYSTSHTMYNRVNYRDYSNSCTGRTMRRPYNFYDILSNDGVNVAHAWYFNCTHHAVTGTWNTGSATEATIGAGVTLPGVTVSAQSGFSGSVDIGFKFNVPGEVCGNNSLGPLSSSVVEADIY